MHAKTFGEDIEISDQARVLRRAVLETNDMAVVFADSVIVLSSSSSARNTRRTRCTPLGTSLAPVVAMFSFRTAVQDAARAFCYHLREFGQWRYTPFPSYISQCIVRHYRSKWGAFLLLLSTWRLDREQIRLGRYCRKASQILRAKKQDGSPRCHWGIWY